MAYCEICGIATPIERHHCVPRRALQSLGIRGTNNKFNLVKVCGPKNLDCHFGLDQLAIRQRLFWDGEGFSPLRYMPPDAYIRKTKKRHKK